MAVTRRIFVSLPADPWISDEQNALKWGVVNRISSAGYQPEIFARHYENPGWAAGKPWAPDRVDEIARRCVGGVVLGLPRWRLNSVDGKEMRFATEFAHYEGAVLNTLRLPLLVLADETIARRVMFGESSFFMTFIPADADDQWLETDAFTVAFDYWIKQLEMRRDVFLGYSSGSYGAAQAVKVKMLQLGATVLDWNEFPPSGSTILEQIEEAVRRCSGGVFLFTNDDDLAEGSSHKAAPRDNVVFEAGFFAAAKGRDRVLIIREEGSKLPADLGGSIYVPFTEASELAKIGDDLTKYLNQL